MDSRVFLLHVTIVAIDFEVILQILKYSHGGSGGLSRTQSDLVFKQIAEYSYRFLSVCMAAWVACVFTNILKQSYGYLGGLS